MRHFAGYKAHWINKNGNAVLSKNNTLYRYYYQEDAIRKIWDFKYQNSAMGLVNRGLIERFLRGGIHHVLYLNDQYIVFFDRKIIILKENIINSTHEIKTCKRPLNICYDAENGHIYWGDYIAGGKRFPINIYRSKNCGKDWEVAYTFPAGKIRHIHNIIYDRFRKHYWILTGDTDSESGIWETKDFKHVKHLLRGSQKYRATSLIPLKDGLIIPTDTEYEKNYIQYYSYADHSLKSIREIANSSITANRIDEFSFVGTMVEPSPVNKSKKTKLYVSKNNQDWIELLSLKRDILPGKYFQYPAINMPIYVNNNLADRYYFNVKNTKNNSGVVVFTKNEIQDVINRNQ
jgi:hypothetical protein